EAIGKGKSGFESFAQALDYFRKTNSITSNPVPGDIVIFEVKTNSNAQKNSTISYNVGIFTNWTRQTGSYDLIQGNAAQSGAAQGEGVYRLTRNTNDFKTYFIHIERVAAAK